VEVCTRMT